MIKFEIIEAIINNRKEKLPLLLGIQPMLAKHRDCFVSIAALCDDMSLNVNAPIYKKLSKDYPILLKCLTRKEDISAIINSYNKAINEYEVLITRYSRDAIEIGVLGVSGAGKSRVLQQISGLGNDCIPSFGGLTCTGAISTIEYANTLPNSSVIYAYIEFKSEANFVNEINDLIRNVISEENVVQSINEIKNINITGCFDGNTTRFKTTYVDNFNIWSVYIGLSDNPKEIDGFQPYLYRKGEYIPLKDATRENGEKILYGCSEPELIREFVTQHYENGVSYYKYPAVEHVSIQSIDNITEVNGLRFIDTVGLDDANEGFSELVRNALKNKCDAAILLLKNEDRANTADNQFKHINKCLTKTFITEEFIETWLGVINNLNSNNPDAMQRAQDVEKYFFIDCKQLADKTIENIKIVDVSDVHELKVFLNSFLATLNFEELDKRISKRAEEFAEESRRAHYAFVKSLPEISIAYGLKNISADYVQKVQKNVLDSIAKLKEKYSNQTTRVYPIVNKINALLNAENEEVLSQLSHIANNAVNYPDAVKAAGIPGKERLFAYIELWQYVRDFARSPDEETNEIIDEFKIELAEILLIDFNLENHGLNASDKDFFNKFAEILLSPREMFSMKDRSRYDRCIDAFKSINDFCLNDYLIVTKKLFDKHSDKYIKPKEKDTLGRVNVSQDELVLELQMRLMEFCTQVRSDIEDNFWLPGVHEDIYNELSSFAILFDGIYSIDWSTIFDNLYEKGVILNSEKELSESVNKIIGNIKKDFDTIKEI